MYFTIQKVAWFQRKTKQYEDFRSDRITSHKSLEVLSILIL